MRYVRSLARHGVVRLVSGEFEGVVAAEAISAVYDVTADASHDARLARLEVSDSVEMPLTWTANSSCTEVNLAKNEQYFY